ncbi:hypothetical protein H1C71_011911 [Ictidomys tridecemlineatus]|nr:hypothetical protein H1C71_011911 [Ictidomys tridecemlineatus]
MGIFLTWGESAGAAHGLCRWQTGLVVAPTHHLPSCSWEQSPAVLRGFSHQAPLGCVDIKTPPSPTLHPYQPRLRKLVVFCDQVLPFRQCLSSWCSFSSVVALRLVAGSHHQLGLVQPQGPTQNSLLSHFSVHRWQKPRDSASLFLVVLQYLVPGGAAPGSPALEPTGSSLKPVTTAHEAPNQSSCPLAYHPSSSCATRPGSHVLHTSHFPDPKSEDTEGNISSDTYSTSRLCGPRGRSCSPPGSNGMLQPTPAGASAPAQLCKWRTASPKLPQVPAQSQVDLPVP